MRSLSKDIPPVKPTDLVPTLIASLEPFQNLLALVSSQGGLPNLRGRYTPTVLAALDRTLAEVERVIHSLLNDKDWASLHGRVDHRYSGSHHSMKSNGNNRRSSAKSQANVLDLLSDIDYD